MTTLTSSLGWTSATNTTIQVQVYAHNSDGSSTAATITDTSVNSTNYVYAPQIAPTITAQTYNDDQVNVTLTCLAGADAGWYENTYLTTYSILYRKITDTVWLDKNVTCASGP